MNIDEFRETVSSYGLNPDELLTVVKDVYLASELPILLCNERDCTKLYGVSDENLELLKLLGVVKEYSKGTYSAGRDLYARRRLAKANVIELSRRALRSGKVFYTYLSSIGEKIAEQYLEILLDTYRDIIRDLFSKYPEAYIGFLRFISEKMNTNILRIPVERVSKDYVTIPTLYLTCGFVSWLKDLLEAVATLHYKTINLLEDLKHIGLAIRYPAKGYLRKAHRER